MQEAKSEVLTPDGVRLSVTTFTADDTKAATAPAGIRDVLLLHGWPNAGRVWQEFAAALLTAGGYRLVAPDFRGFGDSDKTAQGYTCAQFARDAVAVAQEAGLTAYAVIGHSMGGKIAQVVAALQPEGMHALVLLAPSPLVIAAPVPEAKRAVQRSAQGEATKTRELIASMAARPLTAALVEQLTEDGLRTTPAAWNGWIDAMREEDLSASLPRIAVPTLVLGGEKDPLRTEEGLRRDVAERIAGATLEMLPGVGHLLHVEDPTGLALAVANFLDTVPVASGGTA